MKQIFLVNDQKGLIKAYATFKEGKTAFDQMCSEHIRVMSDNPSFSYRRSQTDVDGQKLFQFCSHHRSIVKGKPRFFNDIFSFQAITIAE